MRLSLVHIATNSTKCTPPPPSAQTRALLGSCQGHTPISLLVASNQLANFQNRPNPPHPQSTPAKSQLHPLATAPRGKQLRSSSAHNVGSHGTACNQTTASPSAHKPCEGLPWRPHLRAVAGTNLAVEIDTSTGGFSRRFGGGRGGGV